jgi:hypothetical protein
LFPKSKETKDHFNKKENETPHYLSTNIPPFPPPRPFQFDFQNYISSEDTSAFQVNGAASLKAKKSPSLFPFDGKVHTIQALL